MIENGVSNTIHYRDDIFTAGTPDTVECSNNMDIMFETCNTCGVEINPKKTVQPTTQLEFLGIIVDSVRMELRISEVRLTAVRQELLWWYGRKIGTKRSLLSLIGKLSFISSVITPGKTFLRRLITLSMQGKQLSHKMRLNAMARADVEWWLTCVDSWNRKSVFLDDLWQTSVDCRLYTDASGFGIGGVFGHLWFSEPLSPIECTYSIAWRELLAVLVACRSWGELLLGKKLLLYCDNESVVNIVNSGTSKCQRVMQLVRSLFFLAVRYNFDIRLRHVPGVDNTAADLLSRNRLNEFLSTFGETYVKTPTPGSREF
jgi:hypothetical protein